MAAPVRQASLAAAIPNPALVRGAGGRSNALLALLILFLILEYARPPGIVQLKLQMILSLVLPVLCYVSLKDRRWSPTLSCQLGLIAVTATGVLWAHNYFAAYFVTRILFGNISIAICIAWLLARMDYFRRGMWAWTLIMGYVGVYGIVMGGFGPGGIIGDENEVALACNTAVPMAYFGAVGSKGLFRRLIYLGLGIVLLSAVVISNSRGGFVGLALTVVYMIIVSKHRIRAFLGLAIASAIFFAVIPESYRNEILSIEKEATNEVEDGTGDARFFLWTAAFNMWKDHPVLGVGAGNSKFHTGQYQPDWEGAIYQERDWSGTVIHSGVFELLSETGTIGVLLYGAMLVNHFSTLRRIRRTAREARGLPESLRSELEMYSGALAAGIIGYIGSGLFLSVAYHPYAFYFSALSLALSWSLDVEIARIAGRARGAAPAQGGGAPNSARPTAGSAPSGSGSGSLGSGLLAR